MNTQVFRLHEAYSDNPTTLERAEDFIIIQQAATLLGQNELVAFPTETVYGLGGNAFSEEAVARIFTAKGRPEDNPLIVHICQKTDLRKVASSWPPLADALMNRFWPGPLTLILPRHPNIAPRVSAGLETVAVRMPDHPVALRLLQAVGLPIAAPSANRSGRPSPTRAEHVVEDLDGVIAAVLDAGSTREGVESTVLDLSGSVPRILRPGSITREMLLTYCPNLDEEPVAEEDTNTPQSPGMKYTHYAPKAPLRLFIGSPDATLPRILDDLNTMLRTGRKVALLTPGPVVGAELANLWIDLSKATTESGLERNVLQNISANLYAALRKCDEEQVSFILVQGLVSEGLGEAIMNRLSKAAREVVYVEDPPDGLF